MLLFKKKYGNKQIFLPICLTISKSIGFIEMHVLHLKNSAHLSFCMVIRMGIPISPSHWSSIVVLYLHFLYYQQGWAHLHVHLAVYISFMDCLFIPLAYFSLRLPFFLSICRSWKRFLISSYTHHPALILSTQGQYILLSISTPCMDSSEANPQHHTKPSVNILVGKPKRSKLLKYPQ